MSVENAYGLSQRLLNLFNSCLVNTKQYVSYEGQSILNNYAKSRSTESLQFGTISFLLFINDMVYLIDWSKFSIDDVYIYYATTVTEYQTSRKYYFCCEIKSFI